ncbi:hypothetical protein VP01_2125g3 [Puccinia sorghi]|uniref:Uncharacterized protein n=1 Tax=Puccinia sorghi TaxID=27349 RepID=A0A0L6VA29_9BASI|nr:hypothetical protein VP01_2125g3 [Puccinia sorghi]
MLLSYYLLFVHFFLKLDILWILAIKTISYVQNGPQERSYPWHRLTLILLFHHHRCLSAPLPSFLLTSQRLHLILTADYWCFSTHQLLTTVQHKGRDTLIHPCLYTQQKSLLDQTRLSFDSELSHVLAVQLTLASTATHKPYITNLIQAQLMLEFIHIILLLLLLLFLQDVHFCGDIRHLHDPLKSSLKNQLEASAQFGGKSCTSSIASSRFPSRLMSTEHIYQHLRTQSSTHISNYPFSHFVFVEQGTQHKYFFFFFLFFWKKNIISSFKKKKKKTTPFFSHSFIHSIELFCLVLVFFFFFCVSQKRKKDGLLLSTTAASDRKKPGRGEKIKAPEPSRLNARGVIIISYYKLRR